MDKPKNKRKISINDIIAGIILIAQDGVAWRRLRPSKGKYQIYYYYFYYFHNTHFHNTHNVIFLHAILSCGLNCLFDPEFSRRCMGPSLQPQLSQVA